MEWQWLGNPWVVGIVGSIPGGFLVNWLTGLVLGKRENREYLQKVNGANREVVYAIRPGISEGQIPAADVLKSLINATARRYSVEASDLYSPAQIAEELVKEVMDSSFISATQKADFCARLTELSDKSKEIEPLEPAKEVQKKTAAEYRQRLISAMSMMLGLVTSVMIASLTLFDSVRSKKLSASLTGDDGKHLELFTPLFAALVTMSVSLVAMMAYRDLTRRRRTEAIEQLESELFKTPRLKMDISRDMRRRKLPDE